MNEQKVICSECGSTNVEYLVWFNCKTGHLGEVSNDDEDTWCNDCQEHTGLKFK